MTVPTSDPATDPAPDPATVPARVLAGLLAVTGTAHFVAPGPFETMVPEALGSPAFWVYASGVAELACAVGLAVPRTRRVAGWATAALFVGVFPANIQMALDAVQGESSVSPAVALGRLPLQVPLIWWALWIARRTTAPTRPTRPTRPA